MRTDATLDVAAPVEAVLPYVSDLAQYPTWMPLVHAVEVDTAISSDGDTSWIVELRAKVGVFARSKRLRMVRTRNDTGRYVFERRETDGRRHSPWTLTVDVDPTPAGSRVVVRLEYGGSLWTAGVLDKVLASQIEAGKAGLARVATSHGH